MKLLSTSTVVRSLICLCVTVPGSAQDLKLPGAKDSLHFAVLGDTGTGGDAQIQVGRQLAIFRQKFPFSIALMMGDNMYGGQTPKDFVKKFEHPYAPLLSEGVKFYASLGNHDNPDQRFYEKFNMNGQRYYTFKAQDQVRFFALDSTYLDRAQIEWLEKALSSANEDWKIVYFHHPPYSSGETHGSNAQMRSVLEPIFLRHHVSVVMSGHEHFYERIKPQNGIHYFIVGSSAKLRRGNIQKTALTAKGFDEDNVFMLCEIQGDTFFFQGITRTGATLDSGSIQRPKMAIKPAGSP